MQLLDTFKADNVSSRGVVFFSSSYNEHSHNLFFKKLFVFHLNNPLNNLITQVPVFQGQQKEGPGNMWPDIAIYCHSRDLLFSNSTGSDQVQITVTVLQGSAC